MTSVYRQFADAAAFREAIDTLERTPDRAEDQSNQLSLLPDGADSTDSTDSTASTGRGGKKS